MGVQVPISHSFNLPDGREVVIETGKLATQADGSVVIKIGKTMLFCSVCSAKEPREGQSFFPLSVDYQEKFAAIGRIPGNFMRREGRLSDYEVLTSRLVDRVIRPLFPDGYMNDTQVIINLISADTEELPDSYVALAASAALAVSDIPFAEPISEVRVARIDGEFVINPTRSALANADIEIILGATKDNVMMVEGEANECSELELIEAIKAGHEAIRVQCAAQEALAQKVGGKALNKRVPAPQEEDADVLAFVEGLIKDEVIKIAKSAFNKEERKNAFEVLKASFKADTLEQKGEEFAAEKKALLSKYFDKVKKKTIRTVLLDEGIRLDGRKKDEVRPIWTEVDYLPSAHGSAIFNRGETQALTSLTLGTKQDEQMVDTVLDSHFSDFILHYNFPGFSVGEVKPQRGPGRREVGHANLAGRSLKKTLPADFPYTIRLVADILESNGSSSMATVCSGSLALMDGGVPVTAPISGITMGMVAENGKTAILSDILGDEDALGDMDFKVTGTAKGICGCQMDIKIDGLPYELLVEALEQAREGRLHILEQMDKSLEASRADLKPHAPRIVKIEFDKEFIGAVIGPGGKVIQGIQKDSGAVVNIEETEKSGVATISSADKDSLDKATAMIKSIVTKPEVGDIYEGKVASVQPYGVFVDFLPGKSGLVHISELSWTRIEKIEDTGLTQGEEIKIKIIGIDAKTGKFKLSRKVLMDKPA